MNPETDPLAADVPLLTERAPAARTDAHGLARQAYGEAVFLSQNLLEDSESMDSGHFAGIAASVERLTALLKDDNQHLLALTARTTPGNYLTGHCANVTALCLRLGVSLGWGDDALKALGMAAMLHDVGLKHWLSLGMLERRLTAEEVRQLRLHRMETLRLVGQAKGVETPLLSAVVEILRQARVDGPTVRKTRGVSEISRQSAQILSLCDSYEAMSHLRCWRPPMTPYQAIKKVVKFPRDQFDHEIVRLFVSQMTLYPPGTYVRLRSGEVGRVVQVDPRFPTRPIVMFMIDAEGRSLRLPWYADLRHQPLLHIGSAVDETALDIEDLRLKAMFEADRWWF